MSTADMLRARLRLPVISSPMFLVSTPELVIQQCLGGIVGSFPALNARPQAELAVWLGRIDAVLSEARAAGNPHVAPHAVNLVIRKDAPRLSEDLATCVAFKVPLVITSLGAPTEIVQQVHGYGGLVFHDVTTVRHARSALRAGVDGLILVCAGAGGHGGGLSPFALLREVRAFYDGPIVLAGAMTTGADILAAQVMGADLVYMGTRFIATHEAGASEEYKQMIVDSTAADIVYTPYFSGTPANYLGPSITQAGLDLDELKRSGARAEPGERHLRWKSVWGAGQGVGSISDSPGAGLLIDRLADEYAVARSDWRGRLDT